MINQNWSIQSRSNHCHQTTRPFEDGEEFYTALFLGEEEGEFVRRDYSVDAWKELSEELVESVMPLSFWRTSYEKPDENPSNKTAERESAEALLRRLVEEDEAHTENTRFILALMLERRKVLEQTDAQQIESGRLLIYEHKNGEVFIVKDPQLSLDEVDLIREEVSSLLGGGDKPVQDQPAQSANHDAESETPSEEPAPA